MTGMDRADPYSDRVRELFASAAHSGQLAGPTVQMGDQGVRIRLSAELEDARIRAVAFLAWGCPHLIAAAEAFCADMEGREVTALEGFLSAGLMQSLGIPVQKTGRILVLEDAARSLGAKCRENSSLEH